MARQHPQQPRRQRSPHNPAGRLPLLLRWLLVPMAGSLAFASISPPRDAGLMTMGASSGGGRIRIGRMGAAAAASYASAGVPPSFWAPRAGLRLQGGRDGGVEQEAAGRQQQDASWLGAGGLGLVRGGGGGDGGGIIGGGGGGGGGGDGGGQSSGGSGKNSGALVLVAALGTFKSLWGQYAELLESKPVVTKAITAGLIALVGDVLAQLFEHKLACRGLKDGEAPPPLKLHLLRCLAVTVEGIAITGPGLHYLYSTLERLAPAQNGALAALTHVAVDEFIFDPLFVLGFFFLCGAIEGKNLMTEIVPQVRREYWPALKGGWVVSLLFLPLEFATFRCLPLRLRVLVVNLTDVVWTAVVSYFSHLEEDSIQVAQAKAAKALKKAKGA